MKKSIRRQYVIIAALFAFVFGSAGFAFATEEEPPSGLPASSAVAEKEPSGLPAPSATTEEQSNDITEPPPAAQEEPSVIEPLAAPVIEPLAAQSNQVHRLYNRWLHASQSHHYTSDPNEIAVLTAERLPDGSQTWVDEGVKFISASSGTSVFRLYHKDAGLHLITKDQTEVNTLTAPWTHSWVNEGVSFYEPANTTGKKAIYRLYQPDVREHLYTADTNEVVTLVTDHRWRYEGVAFYADEPAGPGLPTVAVAANPVPDEQMVPLAVTFFGNPPTTGEVMFAVWSDTGGQDDLVWYNAKADETGRCFRAEADLFKHNTTGKYYVDAYLKNGTTYTCLGSNTFTIVKLPPQGYVSTSATGNITIEGDILVSGSGSGWHGKLVLQDGRRAISFGIQHDNASGGGRSYNGKDALMFENVKTAGPQYTWHGTASPGKHHIKLEYHSVGIARGYLDGKLIGEVHVDPLQSQVLASYEASSKNRGDTVDVTFTNIVAYVSGKAPNTLGYWTTGTSGGNFKVDEVKVTGKPYGAENAQYATKGGWHLYGTNTIGDWDAHPMVGSKANLVINSW